MSKPKSILVNVVEKVMSNLPEKARFYSELKSRKLDLNDTPDNLFAFHEALKSTFGNHHYSIESLIISTLHEDTKRGVYAEIDAAKAAILLIDIFTEEHKKEIATRQKTL